MPITVFGYVGGSTELLRLYGIHCFFVVNPVNSDIFN
jgi:hypothetical protein